MTFYKIVLTGTDIMVDHYGSPEPIMGFVTCRLVKAESEAMAIATIKRDILVQWNRSFNADRRAGLPRLSVEWIGPVRRWLTRKPRHDFYFFDSNERRDEHLRHLIQPKRRWFRRR